MKLVVPLLTFGLLSTVCQAHTKAPAVTYTVASDLTTPTVTLSPSITKSYSGIYDLPAGEKPGQTVSLRSLPWSATYISGFAIRSTWSMIQTSAGTYYDWSFFDSAVSTAQANNKKISLSVAAGGFCPSWLLNEGVLTLPLSLSLSFASGTQQSTMVMPWDPVFQQQWGALVSAMGARYDSNPTVSYVYIGGAGDYIESFVVQNTTDYANFNAAGGLPMWTQGVENLIDMYAAAFPHTPIIFAIGNPINIPGTPEQADGQSAVEAVINYGLTKYPGHFGLASQGLDYDSNDPTASVGSNYYVNQEISENAETAPVGFQMVGSSTQKTAGNIGSALTAGIALGGKFIEVYKVDCANSKYKSALTTANQELNNP
jgi:hypothetical protein